MPAVPGGPAIGAESTRSDLDRTSRGGRGSPPPGAGPMGQEFAHHRRPASRHHRAFAARGAGEGTMRRIAHLNLLLLLTAALAFGSARGAAAHANYERSEPAANA